MTPQLAPDVELLGPYRDSGLRTPPYLVQRGGRILQVSHLLHAVAAGADGTRTFDEMAAVASAELGRLLSGDDVRFLVEEKLFPAGILALEGTVAGPGPAPVPAAPAPDGRLLALRIRRAVVSAEAMGRWAGRVAFLFRPAVVTAILAGVLAVDLWVFGLVGVGAAVEEVARTPALMLVVLGFVLLSGAFHELGHAAGCRASGGRPGAAGIGVYLWWPVLYSNVTDAYRLHRRGRLRTDLGGIYFNAVFILGLAGLYAVSGWKPLLAVVVIEHLLVLQQLPPWLRLDGFYIVTDLTGVPDILGRVKPALVGLLPGRPPHPDVVALRPGARRLLYGYLASFVVVLILGFVPVVLLMPRSLAASLGAMGLHLSALGDAAGRWDPIMVLLEALQAAMLAFPVIAFALSMGYLVTRPVVRRRRARRVPVRWWLDASELAVVEGTEMPGGGAVDYFGFGPNGELALFGTAGGRPPQEAAARLVTAARTLQGLSADDLDRLLLDGEPFTEVVAGAARRAGRPWNEPEFRSRLDETLSRGDFGLLVLQPKRFGTTLSVYSLTRCANRNKTE